MTNLHPFDRAPVIRVTADGFDLAYRKMGRGPDVLFIHGRNAEALAVARAGLAVEGLPRYATEWLRAMVAEIAYQSGDWADEEPRERRVARGTHRRWWPAAWPRSARRFA